MIVTGLSRGQLFETRLLPQQFSSDRFDPDAIDRAIVEARKVYHRIDDGPNRLLDTTVFDDDGLFDRIRYVDFYRTSTSSWPSSTPTSTPTRRGSARATPAARPTA